MSLIQSSIMISPTLIGFGALVGLSLGITGSGGSILAIPFLVYGVGLPMQTALGISLLMVASIALFGAIRQTYEGNVDWRIAILFSLTGMVVSPVVITLSANIHETFRLLTFAILMLFVSWRMVSSLSKHDSSHSPDQIPPASIARIVLSGASVGALSGFFGVGGGFIIVPQLTLLFAKPYAQAVGTSLAIIALVSVSGFTALLAKGMPLDWLLLLPFIIGGLIGMLVGSHFVDKISERQMKQSFAAITSILALLMILDKLFLH